MKKIIALILIIAACLSITACKKDKNDGGTNEAPKVVGSWYCQETNYSLIINADGTGTLTTDEATDSLKWIYDTSSHLLVLTVSDDPWTQECTYMTDSDTIYGGGLTFTRVNK